MIVLDRLGDQAGSPNSLDERVHVPRRALTTLGHAGACWTAVNRPSTIREPGNVSWSRTSRGHTPASASNPSSTKRWNAWSAPTSRASVVRRGGITKSLSRLRSGRGSEAAHRPRPRYASRSGGAPHGRCGRYRARAGYRLDVGARPRRSARRSSERGVPDHRRHATGGSVLADDASGGGGHEPFQRGGRGHGRGLRPVAGEQPWALVVQARPSSVPACAIVLVWMVNPFEIIALASRAFATYYFFPSDPAGDRLPP